MRVSGKYTSKTSRLSYEKNLLLNRTNFRELIVLGVWQSNETSGENFTVTFLKNGKVEVTSGDTTLEMQYQINHSRLKILSSTETKQDYLYKIENEKLLLSKKGDKLIFYKVKTN